MLKSLSQIPQRLKDGVEDVLVRGTTLYENPVSLEHLQEAQNYVRALPLLVYDAVNERSLELAGVKVERPRASQALLEEMKNSKFIRYKKGSLPQNVEKCVKNDRVLNLDVVSCLKEGCRSMLIGVSDDKKITKKDVRVFIERLEQGYLCWKPKKERKKVLGHLRDMKNGACIPFIVDKEDNTKKSEPYAFSRLYVLNDKEGNKELFWDTLEGNKDRSGFEEWARGQKIKAFGLSIFTSVSVARQMGAKRLFIPENEINGFFKRITSSENSYPFKTKRGKKLGIQTDNDVDEAVPYFHHIDRLRSEHPYVPIQHIELTDYAKKTQDLSNVLSSFKRGIEKEKTQRKIKACINGLKTSVGVLQTLGKGYTTQAQTTQEILLKN